MAIDEAMHTASAFNKVRNSVASRGTTADALEVLVDETTKELPR